MGEEGKEMNRELRCVTYIGPRRNVIICNHKKMKIKKKKTQLEGITQLEKKIIL